MKNHRIAVLGLGIIGSVWARHYAAAQRLAASWNRTPQPDSPGFVARPSEAARLAGVIQIVVADPAAVGSVLGEILPVIGPDQLVIQSSTIDPGSARRFADQVTGTGAQYVEAPFTGSKPAAQAKKIVYYLGGLPSDLERAEEVLELVSQARLRIGTVEQAAALKLAMNLQLAIQMEALAESLAFSRAAGIPDEVYFGALEKNAGYSGLTQLKTAKLRQGDWSPQFSVKHMLKDMRLALGAGSEAALPLTQAVEHCLEQARINGWGDLDFSALFRNLA